MQTEKITAEKQTAGFKFGKYPLTVLNTFGEVHCDGRIYRLLMVQTHEGLKYYSVRLYNARNHFIKQFLFEPELLSDLIALLQEAQR